MACTIAFKNCSNLTHDPPGFAITWMLFMSKVLVNIIELGGLNKKVRLGRGVMSVTQR